MTSFYPKTLESYDDASIIKEIRRVANLLPVGPISKTGFDEVSRVSSSTVQRRFGSWKEALDKAGLGHRYGGRRVSSKMRSQGSRFLRDADLIQEMRAVAAQLGTYTLTAQEFDYASTRIASSVIRSRFGSWKAGLEVAGLRVNPHGRRYSDDEYFENILAVWTHYGRQPIYRELNKAPSTISAGAYEKKFGGWRKALHAFIARVQQDQDKSIKAVQPSIHAVKKTSPVPLSQAEDRRIRIGLRYSILSRDNFRCVLCGASPATDPDCKLHVDHIHAFSRGGKTVPSNLRTLCSHCNIGKGARVESRG